jgi:hypothetical protein
MTTAARSRSRKPPPANPLDASDIVSPQSEKATLAGLLDLIDRDVVALDAITAGLEPEMFVTDCAADVFKAIVAARRANETPRVADVLAELRHQADDQGLDAAKDPARTLLVELASDKINTGPAAARLAQEAAAEVRETHAKRVTINTLAAAVRAVRSPGGDAADIESVARRLGRLQEVIAGGRGDGRELVLETAAGIEPRRINWLWPQRISLGALTIVTGQVGISKSTLTIDIAARVTTGMRWSDGSGSAPRGDVILVGSEDDPGKIVIPRLTAAAADMSRVHICRGVRSANADHLDALLLERDLDLVRRQLDRLTDVRLIVFDPLSENVSADENSNAQIRAALQPLVALAQERDVAIVAVLHQSKKTDLGVVQRIAGASSYGQLARHILAVMNDPEDETVGMERRRLVVVAKNSYGHQNCGQKYRVTTRAGAPAIEWLTGIVEVDADQISSRPSGGAHHAERQSDAADALREALAAGEADAAEVIEAMGRQGFSERQVRRAARTLGVVKQQGFRKWRWSLPTVEPTEAEAGFYSFEEWPQA